MTTPKLTGVSVQARTSVGCARSNRTDCGLLFAMLVALGAADSALAQTITVTGRQTPGCLYTYSGCGVNVIRDPTAEAGTSQIDWSDSASPPCVYSNGWTGTSSYMLSMSSPNATPTSLRVDLTGAASATGRGSAGAEAADYLLITIDQPSCFELLGTASNIAAISGGGFTLTSLLTQFALSGVTTSGPNIYVNGETITAIGPGEVVVRGQLVPGPYRLSVTGGSAYACGLDGNPACTTASEFFRSITLRVAASPPQIIGHPSSVTSCAGGVSTFSVTPSGTGSFSYQWQHEVSTGVWIDLQEGLNGAIGTVGGSRTAALTVGNFGPAAPGAYRATVNNACGSEISSAATLLVCPADFNCAGGVGVQDIFDFLAAWFAADPRADFNNAGGINVQDIFDFLAAWFTGCN